LLALDLQCAGLVPRKVSDHSPTDRTRRRHPQTDRIAALTNLTVLPQAVVPRNYYSQLSDATNRTLLEVGMVEDRGWLPIREQLAYKYALSVDGNTASTRLAMLLASDQVGRHIA